MPDLPDAYVYRDVENDCVVFVKNGRSVNLDGELRHITVEELLAHFEPADLSGVGDA